MTNILKQIFPEAPPVPLPSAPVIAPVPVPSIDPLSPPEPAVWPEPKACDSGRSSQRHTNSSCSLRLDTLETYGVINQAAVF